MGRMHAPGKGISRSSKPFRRVPASWLKLSPENISKIICRSARKGLAPSQIGVVLRDLHGVGRVYNVTNTSILRILRANGLAPSVPEDLSNMIRKAASVRKHLERNRKDYDSKFRLILIESRIHRLSRYYKIKKKLAPTWKYDSKNALSAIQ